MDWEAAGDNTEIERVLDEDQLRGPAYEKL
jgi:hypothetical protein